MAPYEPPSTASLWTHPSAVGDEAFKLEGGDVIIDLSPKQCDQLLVRSSTLRMIDFFNVRFKPHSSFESTTRTVLDKRNGRECKIYKWSLMHKADDCESLPHVGVFLFDQFDSVASASVDRYTVGRDIYASKYASGFGPQSLITPENLHSVRPRAVIAFKILFTCLESCGPKLPEMSLQEGLCCIANAVAYAEYYDCLPMVATALRSLYEGLPYVQNSIREHSLFHVAMTAKLHSEKMLLPIVLWLSVSHDMCMWNNARVDMPRTARHFKLLAYLQRQQLTTDLRKTIKSLFDIAPQRGKGSIWRGIGWVRLTLGDSNAEPSRTASSIAEGLFLDWLSTALELDEDRVARDLYDDRNRTCYVPAGCTFDDVSFIRGVLHIIQTIIDADKEQNYKVLGIHVQDPTKNWPKLPFLCPRYRRKRRVLERFFARDLMAVITRAADVMRTSADSTFEEGAWISNTRFAAIESIPKAGERDGKKDSRAVCFGGIAAEELEGLPWASEPPFPEGPDSCDAQPISNEWADAVGKMDCEKAWHNTCLHV